MSNTTSINELPIDPANGGNNIQLSINEQISPMNNEQNPAVNLDQTTINQLISGLQQVSSLGLTQLKSRDIPQNTQALVQDPEIQPNYIPASSNNDYIQENELNEDIISKYNRNSDKLNQFDLFYDEMQIPFLIAILFFLFQLPIFKKLLNTYFPMFFFKDGNINIYGYVFSSCLFGFIYYIINKLMVMFNHF